MEYHRIPMLWKTNVLFLWIWLRSTEGILAYIDCHQTTNLTTLPREWKNCNVSFQNGYLQALCHVHFNIVLHSVPFELRKMTIETLLVSEDTVRTASEDCAPVCLSLRRVRFEIGDHFHHNLNRSYDNFNLAANTSLWLLYLCEYLITEDVSQMTFGVILEKPPPLAIATCDSKRVNRSGNFSVYGVVDTYLYASLYLNYSSNTNSAWNISLPHTHADITVARRGGKIPVSVLGLPELKPIRHVVFYKCSFHEIWSHGIPHMGNIQHLEFSQSPIETIHPRAFDLIPSVKKISLTGTKLPGVPEAIFSLKTLACLNMSDTDVPPGAEFTIWPGRRNRTSSAVQLITSGSNVVLLHDRDLCGFPNVDELHMDGCHLKILLGSPFICLKKLQVLSLQANEILELNEATLEGLVGLLRLNLSRNRLAVFDGTSILIPLGSLRILDISFNSIQELRMYKPLNSSLEVLVAKHNGIKKWTPPIFSRMTELKMLDLGHNEIVEVDNDMLRDLNRIQNVSLSFNPWDCHSCYLKNLHNFLDNHQVQCTGCVTCKLPEEQHGYHVQSVAWRKEECGGADYYRVYAVPGILSIMSAAVLLYGAYKCRWYFIYVALRIKVGIKGYRSRVNVENYAWDAFVSYHASDSDWVHNILLQKLESPPFKFRLCVAERDFIPGVLITENICRAITQSRVCLFVLSPAFCRSRWCMFELRLAQHGLSHSERCDGLIFVIKEHVRESEMSRTLLFLTKSRTYIEVPPSNATDRQINFFWLQLQAALQRYSSSSTL